MRDAFFLAAAFAIITAAFVLIVRVFREKNVRTCATCRYNDNNACRRYPPQRVYTGDKVPFPVDATVWPVVRPELDWCGEYERKGT